MAAFFIEAKTQKKGEKLSLTGTAIELANMP
jgi:hypothetical protein